jgi:acyl-CoA synthetase (AMP-forming)/AMP-acid ligase II
MNCIARFTGCASDHPRRMALWTEKEGSTDFGRLLDLSARAQAMFRGCGVGPGVPVVLAAAPGPGLFAAICALLGLGAPIVLVEPWMSMARVDHVIGQVKPRVFFTGLAGKLWGLRIPSVRRIPYWRTERDIHDRERTGFEIESMGPTAPAVIAFSSGTTGKPRGAVRTQGYLWEMHEILSAVERPGQHRGPDLAIFPSAALFHLGTGRGAVLAANPWKRRLLATIAQLPDALQPETLSCGPAFLKALLRIPGLDRLRDLYVGGAPCDRWIFEAAFERWPDARITHVYGGSEAEPVALQDAREATRLSAERGYFQTLSVGRPVGILSYELHADAVWVSGPNVCPEYIGDPAENIGIKRRDREGRLWHCMGDRMRADAHGWWYSGRQFQPLEDFELEQSVYALMQSSAAFLHRRRNGELHLLGEQVLRHEVPIRKAFPQIAAVHAATIARDRRHRARIDRKASLLPRFRRELAA